jgi:hypothetical protein
VPPVRVFIVCCLSFCLIIVLAPLRWSSGFLQADYSVTGEGGLTYRIREAEVVYELRSEHIIVKETRDLSSRYRLTSVATHRRR